MTHPLTQNLFLVKEQVGAFKAANNFDIYDPSTGQMVMQCREPNLGLLTKILRFTEWKRMTPFDVEVRDMQGNLVVRVSRGVSFFLSRVIVSDEAERPIGQFKQKFFSIGGAFTVLDMNDAPVCTLKGKWTGWDFRFMTGETELGHVAKKWAGLGREMFTSADNYVLEINDRIPADNPVRKLILAAIMCIDMVLKE